MTFLTGQTTDQSGNQVTEPTNQEDFVKAVVEQKGEQWQNPQVLAKGYKEAQDYIALLEQQTKEMREDIEKNTYAQELLSKLKEQAPSSGEPSGQPNGNTNTEQNTTTQVSETDLVSLIEKTLTEKEKQNTAAQNLAKTEEELTKLFGTEKDKVLEEKVKELGLSEEKLIALASESPSAFMRLIGEAPKKETNQTTEGTLNTNAEFLSQSSSTRNWKHYQDLRKNNQKLYYSPAIQNQMLKDRQEQGEKFYN